MMPGTEGLPEPRTSFPGTPDWAEGRRKDCVFVDILKDFSIFKETSHYAKSV